MRKGPALRLLALCACYDLRTAGDADAAAWGEALGDLDWDDCARAIKAHYRTSSDRMMVADVIKRVEIMNRPTADQERRDKLHLELPEFDPELNARGSAAVRAALAGRHTGEVPSAQQAT